MEQKMAFLDESQWRSIINSVSGLSAGAFSTVLLYPFDFIKTQYQVYDQVGKPFRNLPHAFQSITRQHGYTSLFRGMSPALYGSCMSWGLYMFLYQNAKIRWSKLEDSGHISTYWKYFFAGMEAGLISVPITNPIWLIKVRMQVQATHLQIHANTIGKDAAQKLNVVRNKPYTSVTNAFRRIIAEEGVFALYKGLLPAMLLTTHGAMKFVAYETLKSYYQTHWSPEMDVIPTLAIGALSQMFASTSTYPYQVVKARLQQGGDAALKYSGTWDCITKIARNEGYRGLFKGLVPNLFKVVPSGAIVFATYEQIHRGLTTLLLNDE